MPDSNSNLTADVKNFIDWQLTQRPDPFTTPGNYSSFADFYKAQGIDPYGADMQKFAQDSLARWNPVGDVRQNAYGNSGNEWENPNWAQIDAIRVANTPSPFSVGPYTPPAPSPVPAPAMMRTASVSGDSAQTANQYTTDYDKIVRDAYAQIGRAGVGTNPNQIDQTGLDYWTNQLKGGMSPDDFAKTFGNTVNYLTSAPIEDIKKNSAANNQPNEAVISYVDQYLGDKPVQIKTDNWKAAAGNPLTNTNQVSQLGAAKALSFGNTGGGDVGKMETVGADVTRTLNAGGAPYASNLIKALRNSTGGDYSNNPGVNLSKPSVNLGAITLKPTGGVNNPGVLNPGGGTAQPPSQPPSQPPTSGRGTVGTPADMPAGYAGYWSTKPVGSVINWGGGTLKRVTSDSAIYTTPEGWPVTLSPNSDLNYLALTYPGIAKQWLTEFGFVPTQPTREEGGGGG
jgi:hypothetical protein